MFDRGKSKIFTCDHSGSSIRSSNTKTSGWVKQDCEVYKQEVVPDGGGRTKIKTTILISGTFGVKQSTTGYATNNDGGIFKVNDNSINVDINPSAELISKFDFSKEIQNLWVKIKVPNTLKYTYMEVKTYAPFRFENSVVLIGTVKYIK